MLEADGGAGEKEGSLWDVRSWFEARRQPPASLS